MLLILVDILLGLGGGDSTAFPVGRGGYDSGSGPIFGIFGGQCIGFSRLVCTVGRASSTVVFFSDGFLPF